MTFHPRIFALRRAVSTNYLLGSRVAARKLRLRCTLTQRFGHLCFKRRLNHCDRFVYVRACFDIRRA
jgi:hypothetical protein